MLIARAGLAVSPWRNGAGRKADIAAGPGWMAGFAFLDADAPFSDYTGHDRTITLIKGPGFTLAGPGREELAVAAPFRPATFDGGWAACCRIHGGPCVVLNAMTARDRWRHGVDIHTAADLPSLDPAGAEADIVVVLRGSLRAAGATAERHDAFRLAAPGAAHASEDALLCRIRVEPA